MKQNNIPSTKMQIFKALWLEILLCIILSINLIFLIGSNYIKWRQYKDAESFCLNKKMDHFFSENHICIDKDGREYSIDILREMDRLEN